MSNKAITWAYSRDGLKAGPKFVLVTLADMADQEHSCYPGTALLSKLTGYRLTAITTHIDFLILNGYISIERRHKKNGARTSDRYYLDVDGALNVSPESVDTPTEPNPGIRENVSPESVERTPGIRGDAPYIAFNPQLTLSTEPTTTQSSTPTHVTEPVDNSNSDDWEIHHPTPKTAFGNRQTIDTAALAASVGHVFADTGIDDEQLGALAGIVLGRAKGQVLNPTAYVTAAIRSDPFEWQSQAFDLVSGRAEAGGNLF